MLELYSLTGCPYCATVARTLDELGVSYERHEVAPLRHRRSAVTAVSGRSGVPAVVDTEHGVEGMAESEDIVAYLERTHA